jgi:hypothetical protein
VAITVPVCQKHSRQLWAARFLFWLVVAFIAVSMTFADRAPSLLVLTAAAAYVLGKRYFSMKQALTMFNVDQGGRVIYSTNREELVSKLMELTELDLVVSPFKVRLTYWTRAKCRTS